ncbi:MAG: type II toxin-antitoxin system VapC family toxin [Thermoproteota archaeon]|nr:type II toxin-antitoxin system VapC family toxin [Thermoproteota archaeon]
MKFILKEEGWNKIADFLKAGTISVDLVIKETVNAIWKRVMRKEISLEEAKSMFEAVKEILNKAVIIENEMDYIDEAFEISIKRNVTVYDSLYIALAKKKKLELLTADEIQAQVASLEEVRAIVL